MSASGISRKRIAELRGPSGIQLNSGLLNSVISTTDESLAFAAFAPSVRSLFSKSELFDWPKTIRS